MLSPADNRADARQNHHRGYTAVIRCAPRGRAVLVRMRGAPGTDGFVRLRVDRCVVGAEALDGGVLRSEYDLLRVANVLFTPPHPDLFLEQESFLEHEHLLTHRDDECVAFV